MYRVQHFKFATAATYAVIVIAVGGCGGSKTITDLEATYENCAKIDGATRMFKEEVGRALGVAASNVEVLGGKKEILSYSSCFITVRTPLGPKICLSGPIASEDGGKTAFAVGLGYSENRTCRDP